MHRRPVTLPDITGFIKMTAKQVRRELCHLEELGRIAKVQLRKESNGRLGAAWVIADNCNLPQEIRNACQECMVGTASQNYGAMRLCDRCFMAMKHDGRRIPLSESQEMQLSMWYATIVTMPNEHTLG